MSKPLADHTFTDQERLDAVRQSMQEIALFGQVREAGGRVMTAADLPALQAREKELMGRIAAEASPCVIRNGMALRRQGRRRHS